MPECLVKNVNAECTGGFLAQARMNIDYLLFIHSPVLRRNRFSLGERLLNMHEKAFVLMFYSGENLPLRFTLYSSLTLLYYFSRFPFIFSVLRWTFFSKEKKTLVKKKLKMCTIIKLAHYNILYFHRYGIHVEHKRKFQETCSNPYTYTRREDVSILFTPQAQLLLCGCSKWLWITYGIILMLTAI